MAAALPSCGCYWTPSFRPALEPSRQYDSLVRFGLSLPKRDNISLPLVQVAWCPSTQTSKGVPVTITSRVRRQ